MPRTALLALLLLAGCSGSPTPVAQRAWLRLAAVPGRPAAGYLVLKGGTRPARLTAVSSPAAARIELHETMAAAGGMMRMAPLAAIDVPAGGEVRFAPGGKHLMVFGVAAGVKPGGTMPLRLAFADGGALEVPARVVAAGDPAP